MNKITLDQINDSWIVGQRPEKNSVSHEQPYACFVEKERMPNGQVEDVATLFLTNKECPFHCLMCDLWKNTTDHRVPEGAILVQIEWALEKLPEADHIKLYNSGNFFDRQAIPPSDIPMIADLLNSFKTVTIENHPRLVDTRCLKFQELLKPDLHVAMGLETIHPKILERLNKQMTLEDFKRATHFLTNNDISVRAFILLRPPFLSEEEGVKWAKRSIDFAFSAGVECCVIIPTRAGNGALELLQEARLFSPPRIESLEEVLEYGLQLKFGRVFADLWDIDIFSRCEECRVRRVHRMEQMNITQELAPPIYCDCHNLL